MYMYSFGELCIYFSFISSDWVVFFFVAVSGLVVVLRICLAGELFGFRVNFKFIETIVLFLGHRFGRAFCFGKWLRC
jgi:hypothetical protein